MSFTRRQALARVAAVSGAIAAPAVLMPGARAQDKTFLMKVSSPTINDVPDTFGKYWGTALEKDSGGRIKAEIYPASQLGSIPRQIEGTQFGAIQCEAVPPEFMVGLDERYQVMAAPGLVDSQEHGERVAADPEVRKLMLGLGADKGLRGMALFMAEPTAIICKTPIRHLEDFKGKKLRIFASPFQSVAFEKLGVTPVAMSLGDVLPALQQGAIDGAIAGMGPFTNFHFNDAAKYITLTGQPAIFIIAVVNQKWFDSLPPDLQRLLQKDADEQSIAIKSFAHDLRKEAEVRWTNGGGELIKLPPDEQAAFMKTVSSVGAEVSKSKPALAEAYKIVSDAAARLR
jgi:TRAP-type transport system periplasmic protein